MIVIAIKSITPEFEAGRPYKIAFDTITDSYIYRVKIGNRYLAMREDLFTTYFRVFTL